MKYLASSSQYEFAFIDTCFSAGGTPLPDSGDDETHTSINNVPDISWATVFGADLDPDDDLGLGLDSCFIGWNGYGFISYTLLPGNIHSGDNINNLPIMPTLWNTWRMTFWQQMQQGAFVENSPGSTSFIYGGAVPEAMYALPSTGMQYERPDDTNAASVPRLTVVGDAEIEGY